MGFSESSEYKRKQAENTDVAIAYIFLMGRAPTGEEVADWVGREKGGTSNAALLLELLESAKYAAHITGAAAVAVSAGGFHSCALLSGG
ncbi:MAG: DUF4214 domain-containing protein, partial [Acidimicrobiales bacterium]|nr:DUF4214 domain-containing protein [Acidimicrobiales bacterium]